jgi:hypothetical protein
MTSKNMIKYILQALFNDTDKNFDSSINYLNQCIVLPSCQILIGRNSWLNRIWKNTKKYIEMVLINIVNILLNIIYKFKRNRESHGILLSEEESDIEDEPEMALKRSNGYTMDPL